MIILLILLLVGKIFKARMIIISIIGNRSETFLNVLLLLLVDVICLRGEHLLELKEANFLVFVLV